MATMILLGLHTVSAAQQSDTRHAFCSSFINARV